MVTGRPSKIPRQIVLIQLILQSCLILSARREPTYTAMLGSLSAGAHRVHLFGHLGARQERRVQRSARLSHRVRPRLRAAQARARDACGSRIVRHRRHRPHLPGGEVVRPSHRPGHPRLRTKLFADRHHRPLPDRNPRRAHAHRQDASKSCPSA